MRAEEGKGRQIVGNMSFIKRRNAKRVSILKRALRLYENQGLKSLLYNMALRLVCEYINFLNRKELSASGGYVIKEINGSKMYLDVTDEGLPRDLIIDSVREAYIVETIKKELSEGDVVVDIGANIGYYALLEAKIVGEKGKVYAIEPVPESIGLLKKNARLNGYSNVETFELAIGDKNGFASMHVAKQCNISSMRQIDSHIEGGMISRDISVEVMTLDDFLKDKLYPNVVRMDVEGYEYQIIKGMKKMLEQDVPLTLFIELHFNILKKEEATQLLQTLREAAFQITDVTSETMIRGSTRHRFLWNIASYLERKGSNVAPLGHLKLGFDDILSNTAILDGKWGALEICFKRTLDKDQPNERRYS